MPENKRNQSNQEDYRSQFQHDQQNKNSDEKTHAEKLRYNHADEIYE